MDCRIIVSLAPVGVFLQLSNNDVIKGVGILFILIAFGYMLFDMIWGG
jgi:hypothetical protein